MLRQACAEQVTGGRATATSPSPLRCERKIAQDMLKLYVMKRLPEGCRVPLSEETRASAALRQARGTITELYQRRMARDELVTELYQ